MPILSSFTNTARLFQKCVATREDTKTTQEIKCTYQYLERNTLSRCVLLLIPFLGNIIVGLHDCFKSKPSESTKEKEVVQKPDFPNEEKDSMLYKKEEVIIIAAPWDYDYQNPHLCSDPMPEEWEKCTAQHNMKVPYLNEHSLIQKEATYFRFKGKIAVGFHGTTNPPACQGD